MTGESGYKIERSADGATGWTQIGTTLADQTSYSDMGLAASTQYFYRVRATNAAGDSDYSNISSDTTLAPRHRLPRPILRQRRSRGRKSI